MEPKATITRVVQSPGRGSFAVLEWIESTEHPGLMCALTTGFAAYSLAIDPERLSFQELKSIGSNLLSLSLSLTHTHTHTHKHTYTHTHTHAHIYYK